MAKFLRRAGKLIRRAGKLARSGCRSLCCGGGNPCQCSAAYRITDCGCGSTVDLCCRCSKDFTFTCSIRSSSSFSIQNGIIITDITNGHDPNPHHCGGISQFGSSEQTMEIRVVQRCVNGHPTQDYTGCEFHRRRTSNGVALPPEDAFGFAAYLLFIDAYHPGDLCMISRPTFGSGPPGFRDQIRPCCAGSGHFRFEWNSYPGPGLMGCVDSSDSGFYEDDSTDSTITACGGGSQSSAGSSTAVWNYNHDTAGDPTHPDFVFHIEGTRTDTAQWDNAASWSYHNDSACDPDPCTPIPVGACCRAFYFGSPCLETTAENCALLAGQYHGDGSICQSATSPGGVVCPPTGACCLTTGGCLETTRVQCQLVLHGSYQGDDTHCSSSQCAQGFGACCAPDGAGGFTCVPTDAAGCALLNGTFKGVGTQCQVDTCDVLAVTGGCCVNGQCSLQTSHDCATAHGLYLGDGTSCTGNPCGATGTCCCDAGTPTRNCVEGVTQTVCKQRFGNCVWIPDPAPTCSQLNCNRPFGHPIDPIDQAAGLRDLV